MQLFLTITSGLCWTIVYLKAIQIGFKQKTYAMPVAALSLNFAWEFLYSLEIFKIQNPQRVINIVWCLFDIIIMYTYFKYGKKYFSENTKKLFIPISRLPRKIRIKIFYEWGSAQNPAIFYKKLSKI